MKLLIGSNDRDFLIGSNDRDLLIGSNDRDLLFGSNDRDNNSIITRLVSVIDVRYRWIQTADDRRGAVKQTRIG